MFNKRIQEEFDGRVKKRGLDGIRVQTFHSLGNAICSWTVKNDLMPSYTTVEDDAEIDGLIRKAAGEVIRKGGLGARASCRSGAGPARRAGREGGGPRGTGRRHGSSSCVMYPGR
jgi:hypothetical protein